MKVDETRDGIETKKYNPRIATTIFVQKYQNTEISKFKWVYLK